MKAFMRNVIEVIILLALLPTAHAQSSSTDLGLLTYHGRIVLSNGTPLVAPSVSFRVQVRSPGTENCLLYEEDHILDMTKSDGIFALNIGAGLPTSAASHPLSRVFSNKNEELTDLACKIGDSYRPNSVDARRLVISFNDGSGYQTLQVQQVNNVPYSLESRQVGGYPAESLLKVENGKASAISSAQFTELMNLISGISNQYTKPGEMSGGALPPALQANETIKWDGTKWITHVLTGTTSGTVINITAGTGLQIEGAAENHITNEGTIGLTDTGVTPGTYGNSTSVASIQVDAQGRLLSAVSIPISSSENFSGALQGDVSGTQSATSVDKIKGTSLSSLTPVAGQFLKSVDKDATIEWQPHFLNITDIKSSTNPLDSVFPLNCTNEQTMVHNPIMDRFECQNIALVNTTNVLNGDVTGSVSNNNVIGIQGRSVASTAPIIGQVLKWDGSKWTPGTDSNSGGTITGGGSAGYLTKWSNGSAIGNSTVTDDGSAIYTQGRNIALGGSGSAFSTSPLEVRVATPRVSFHWPGVVAGQIGMDSAGNIRTFDNPGTGYAPFIASSITANGEVYSNGYFRTYGNAMTYNQTYGIGWSPSAGTLNILGAARIGNVQEPYYGSDAATKQYVDARSAPPNCGGRYHGEVWTNDGGTPYTAPSNCYLARTTYQCVAGGTRAYTNQSACGGDGDGF